MTDTTQAAAPAADKKTVADDMDKRRIFANTTDAAAYLNQMATTLSDFDSVPLAAPGMILEGDDAGDFDPKVYTPSMQVMVAVLSKKGKGAKAIVVAPIPTLDSILASTTGKDWLLKIAQKELNHVAVRDLREAEDISTVVDKMPKTLDEYISSARDTGGGIMEAFDELYKGLNATLSAKVPVWAKARLVKSELRKCMESAGYAGEYYPSLENRGAGKDSLFVVALNLGVSVAKAKGFDPTIFERWLATRDAKTYAPGEDDEAEDFDIDSMSASMLADTTKAEAPAAPAPTA